MSILAVQDNLAFLLIAIIIATVLAGIIVFVYIRKRRHRPVTRAQGSADRPVSRLDYMPPVFPAGETRPRRSILAAQRSSRPIARIPELPAVPETELVRDRADITASLLALAGKYFFDEFTLATHDGLVFASTGSENALNDAALYSSMHADNPGSSIPGIILFDLVHKNAGLIGIIRTRKPVPEIMLNKIVADTKDILNWWI